MEEISWGQWLIRFQTPQSLKAINTQKELNLHNNVLIWPMVYYGYALVGVYGGFTWIGKWLFQDQINKIPPLKRWSSILIPPGYLALCFYFNLLYVWLRFKNGYWQFSRFEELSELYLVLAIIIFFIPIKNTVKDWPKAHLKQTKIRAEL